jgi:hypothetical protein
MNSKKVSAFEAEVDRILDLFPFEGRQCAKKYLYLLEFDLHDLEESSSGIRFKKGEETGFIDWFGTVSWGV